MLEGLGYTNVAALDGGVEAWKAARYEMELGALSEPDSSRGAAGAAAATAENVSISEEEFQRLPLIVKIHADWCVKCQAISETWHRIEKELADEARVVTLDVTDKTTFQAALATARDLGLEDFFAQNSTRTGSVVIFKPGTTVPAKILVGETNFEMYKEALREVAAT